MALFPKVGEMTAMLDERFNRLLGAIENMHATLRHVLEELRTMNQKGNANG